MNYFLVAILIGVVLRFVARVGVLHSIKTAKTDKDLGIGFNLSILSFVIGSILLYAGVLFLAANFVKNLI